MGRQRRVAGGGAALALLALMGAGPTAGCTSDDEDAVRYCTTDGQCHANEVCGTTSCSGLTRCIPAECECVSNSDYLFAPGDACLNATPSACNCDHATCDQPWDSCNRGVCPGVCQLGESCSVCLQGDACESIDPCLGSSCISNYSLTAAACRSSDCWGALKPPLCGTPDALCGSECCPPDCTGRVCGDDPRCGLSCGTCDNESYCTIDGQCQVTSEVAQCAGDLRTTPPEVVAEAATGSMPTPLGGTIDDGIYDLIGIREYVEDPVAEIYERAAQRFSVGATQVELIYDSNLNFSTGYAPHRLMTVAAEGPVLHITVNCPATLLPGNQQYDVGFTVQGTELWIFKTNLIEVYSLRL